MIFLWHTFLPLAQFLLHILPHSLKCWVADCEICDTRHAEVVSHQLHSQLCMIVPAQVWLSICNRGKRYEKVHCACCTALQERAH